MAKLALISLGCAKNQVNAEEMRYLLNQAGHVSTEMPQGADVAVVNTCGFIDTAKSEAIAQILELAELKNEGNLGHILVTGCLSQRYGEEILEEIPEVDAVLGTGSYHEIVSAVERVCKGEKVSLFGDIDAPLADSGRVIVGAKGWAYLKIAEGCNRHCAYCVIPSLRGKFRSRPLESLIKEARRLTAAGVRELILVAQDITQYGEDLYGEKKLPELITQLAGIPELTWIRLHYLYPDGVDDVLIAAIQNTEKVLRYLDIPIQHINDGILKAMNRKGGKAEISALFSKIKKTMPDMVFRTSLIAGLPGEREAEFEELVNFLEETNIQRAGVFPYSPQEGTPAAAMPGRPTEEEAEQRANRLSAISAGIMDAFNQSRIGQTESVLCIGYDENRAAYYGRSFAESPDIDGVIWFQSAKDFVPGDFYQMRYTEEIDGELWAIPQAPEEKVS